MDLKNITIRTKLLIAFLLLALVPLTIVSYNVINDASELIQNEAKSKLSFAATEQGRDITDIFHQLASDISTLQESFTVGKNFQTLQEKRNMKTNDEYTLAVTELNKKLKVWAKEHTYVHDVLLTDTKGVVLYTSNASRKELVDFPLPVGGDQWLEKGTEGPFISDIFVGPLNDGPGVIVSAPIKKVDGNTTGIIVLLVDAQLIYGKLSTSMLLGESAESYLVNIDKVMISPSRFRPGAAFRQEVDTETIEQCLKHAEQKEQNSVVGEEMWVYKNYQKKKVLGTYHYLPIRAWCLIVEINEEEVYSPLAALRGNFQWIIILTLITVLVAVLYVSRLISQPIELLTEAADKVNKGNMSVKQLSVKSNDEIGKLTTAFNRLLAAAKILSHQSSKVTSKKASKKKQGKVLQ